MGRSAWYHVIQMCGKRVSLHGQFHESTNVNQRHCQCVEKSGFSCAVSWANQSKHRVIPMSGKIVVYMASSMNRPM